MLLLNLLLLVDFMQFETDLARPLSYAFCVLGDTDLLQLQGMRVLPHRCELLADCSLRILAGRYALFSLGQY